MQAITTSQAIDAIKREDYILVDGERVVVKRVTNRDIALRHSADGVTVYTVQDTEDGYLGAIKAEDYRGRISKAERTKLALNNAVDKLVDKGMTREDAIEALTGIF